jgi:hypothetical protein
VSYHQQELGDLHERLTALEKQNRRFKQLGIAGLIGAALLLVMGQAPSKKTVEANAFILKDAGGNTRATLYMTEKSTTSMTAPGSTVSGPVTFDPSPSLVFYDANGHVLAHLEADSTSGGPFVFLALYDAKGNRGAWLTGDGQVTGRGLAVVDPEGKELGTFLAVAGYGAGLQILNGKGEQRAFLGPGNLEVSDDEGFKAGLGVEKNLVTMRTGETHQTSAASLVLFDKDKKVIWKAP